MLQILILQEEGSLSTTSCYSAAVLTTILVHADVVVFFLHEFLTVVLQTETQSIFFLLNESCSAADTKPLYSLKRHLFLVSMPPLEVNSSFQ